MNLKLWNSGHDVKKRSLCISQIHHPMIAYYSPEDRRWYTDFDADKNEVVIKSGKAKLSDFPKRKSVVRVFCFCLEDKTEVLFLKDESGHFGLFTMAFDGRYYCSDRGGFCYKSAHFYWDTWTNTFESSVHYMTLENLNGQWSMIRLCCPQRYDRNHRILSPNFGVERKCIVKGCGCEEETLAHLADFGGPDFKDAKRFSWYDLTDNNSQDFFESMYPGQYSNGGDFRIEGHIVEVSAFSSINSSNSWRRCSISMWPISQLRRVCHVNDNDSLFEEIRQLCSSRYGEGIDFEFHNTLKDFAVRNGIRFRIVMEEESMDSSK